MPGMDDFSYRDGTLWSEQVSLASVAERFGTPVYVYSRSTLVDHYRRFAKAFQSISPLICFSAKALSNVHLLRVLAQQGAGVDVVSGGELHRAMVAGVDPERVVFAGVGKSADELRLAVRRDIRCINVESEAEVDLLASIAREERRRPRLAIRVNPDVAPDQRTPAKTTTGTRGGKFGIDIDRARRRAVRAHLRRRVPARRGLPSAPRQPHLRPAGVRARAGSTAGRGDRA
jgi:diaminopimelate decarboxylase